MPEESRDTRRGIQNVQQRVSDIPSRETVGERHLRGGKWGPKAANDAEVIQAANDEYAYAIAVAEIEEQETQQQSRIQHAIREKAKKMLLKNALVKKTLLARLSIRSTLWYVFIAYLLQVVFAVGALVGLGIMGLASSNVVTKFIASLTPLEPLGLMCLGLGVMLSLVVLIGYLIFFRFLGISILQNSILFSVTIVCFFGSFAPGASLFPWLVCWVIYISLSSSVE